MRLKYILVPAAFIPALISCGGSQVDSLPSSVEDSGGSLSLKKKKDKSGSKKSCVIKDKTGDKIFNAQVGKKECGVQCDKWSLKKKRILCSFDSKPFNAGTAPQAEPLVPAAIPKRSGVPRPSVQSAFFDAENSLHVESDGDVISNDLKYAASHRKCAGAAGSQPDSPFWEKVSGPVYEGKYSYKVVSQVGNGRNEQRVLKDFAPITDGARWFSFAVNIDPSTRPTGGHFFFAQLHQNVEINPPLFMLYNGTSWQLVVRTDNGVKGVNKRTVLASGGMTAGKWYEFKLKLKPGVKGTGELGLWQKENGSWKAQQLNWGSGPVNSFGFHYQGDGAVNSFADFNFKAGIYRGGYSTKATVYIDKLRYGQSEADLD